MAPGALGGGRRLTAAVHWPLPPPPFSQEPEKTGDQRVERAEVLGLRELVSAQVVEAQRKPRDLRALKEGVSVQTGFLIENVCGSFRRRLLDRNVRVNACVRCRFPVVRRAALTASDEHQLLDEAGLGQDDVDHAVGAVSAVAAERGACGAVGVQPSPLLVGGCGASQVLDDSGGAK
eukprot:845332-Pleurochrysis_carterae.AAC.1